MRDREAWHTALHGVTKSQTWLNWTFVYLIYISLTIVKESLGFPGGSEVKKKKNHLPMQEMQVTLVQSLDWEDPLEEGIATTPLFLPGKSPQTEEPGRLQSMGLQTRLSNLAHTASPGQGWASSSLQWGASLKGGLSSWPRRSQRSLPSSWCSWVHGDSEKAGEAWKITLTWQCFPGLA